MKRNKSFFWPVQAGIWIGLGLLNLLAQHFSPNAPSIIRYLNAASVSTGGLVVTSVFRYFFKKRYAHFGTDAGKFILSILGATLIQAVCWLSLIFLVFLPLLKTYKISLIQLVLNIVPLSILLLIWNLVYLGYNLIKRYHLTEVEKWKLEAEVQKAQMGALKSQINPHFMFNALNNIRALILENPQLARQTITKFSEILRYALQHTENKEITISEELNMISQYLDLVKIQYEEKLKFSIHAEDEVMKIAIPPMILQLLIENAVKHGIALNVLGGEIIIDIKYHAAILVLTVKNTGTLKQKNKLEESLGIGLNNIRERLILLYNNKAKLEIRENLPYVEIIITIDKS